jgi:Metal-dependent hydrolase
METVTIKVVTYNIRYDTTEDGKNAFAGNRAQFVKQWLSKFDADLFGFQEVLPHVKEWLVQNMPDFQIVGSGRNADFKGECTCIAFKKSTFDLFSLETFWLSDTPTIPGSRFPTDQSLCPRVCTCATLIHKQSGKVFYHYNTHLDNSGELARCCGASMIVQKIDRDKKVFDGKYILTGDFNAFPDSAVLQTFLAYDKENVTDTTCLVDHTFHDYERQPNYPRIDYIITDGKTDPKKTFVIKDHTEDGIYLSDHYPVCAFVEI